MITLEQLVSRVREEVRDELGLFTLPPSLSRTVIEHIVRSTLKAVDLHVDDKGEVYSPVPPPNPLPPPRESGAHWLGSGKGRRGEGGRRRRR